MERRTGIHRVKLQSYLLIPEDGEDRFAIDLLSDHVMVKVVGAKETSFAFDSSFVMSGSHDMSTIPEEFMSRLDCNVTMATMGYASTVLCYFPQSQHLPTHSKSIMDRILQNLFDVRPAGSAPVETIGQSTKRIEMACYELIDNQIRDLLVEDGVYKSTGTGGTADIKLRDTSGDGQLYVDGVSVDAYPSFSTITNALAGAFNRRMVCLGGKDINGGTSSAASAYKTTSELAAGLKAEVLGAIGNCVVQLRIATTTSFSHGDKNHSLTKTAVLSVVFLATNDTLLAATDFKGYKAFTPQGNLLYSPSVSSPTTPTVSFLSPPAWLSPDEQTGRINQLRNALKAVATLTRVVNALVEKNEAPASSTSSSSSLSFDASATATNPTRSGTNKASPNVALPPLSSSPSTTASVGMAGASKRRLSSITPSPSTTASSADSTAAISKRDKPSIHVPFRDSVLTRLLKPSLEGNCFVSMVTIPPENIDSASRALRFASQISQLHNVVWIKEALAIHRLLQAQRTRPAGGGGDAAATDDAAALDSTNAATAAAGEEEAPSSYFDSMVSLMKDEISQLEDDLARFERARELALQQLAIGLQSVKTYDMTSSSLPGRTTVFPLASLLSPEPSPSKPAATDDGDGPEPFSSSLSTLRRRSPSTGPSPSSPATATASSSSSLRWQSLASSSSPSDGIGGNALRSTPPKTPPMASHSQSPSVDGDGDNGSVRSAASPVAVGAASPLAEARPPRGGVHAAGSKPTLLPLPNRRLSAPTSMATAVAAAVAANVKQRHGHSHSYGRSGGAADAGAVASSLPRGGAKATGAGIATSRTVEDIDEASAAHPSSRSGADLVHPASSSAALRPLVTKSQAQVQALTPPEAKPPLLKGSSATGSPAVAPSPGRAPPPLRRSGSSSSRPLLSPVVITTPPAAHGHGHGPSGQGSDGGGGEGRSGEGLHAPPPTPLAAGGRSLLSSSSQRSQRSLHPTTANLSSGSGSSSGSSSGSRSSLSGSLSVAAVNGHGKSPASEGSSSSSRPPLVRASSLPPVTPPQRRKSSTLAAPSTGSNTAAGSSSADRSRRAASTVADGTTQNNNTDDDADADTDASSATAAAAVDGAAALQRPSRSDGPADNAAATVVVVPFPAMTPAAPSGDRADDIRETDAVDAAAEDEDDGNATAAIATAAAAAAAAAVAPADDNDHDNDDDDDDDEAPTNCAADTVPVDAPPSTAALRRGHSTGSSSSLARLPSIGKAPASGSAPRLLVKQSSATARQQQRHQPTDSGADSDDRRVAAAAAAATSNNDDGDGDGDGNETTAATSDDPAATSGDPAAAHAVDVIATAASSPSDRNIVRNDPSSSPSRSRRQRRREEDNDDNDDDDGADSDGLTSLERRFLRAVATCNMTVTLECLRAGVNIHVKNTFDRDAMQIAARHGSVPMLALIHQHGGSLSTRGPKGDTLFHLAAYNGHVETMQWLLHTQQRLLPAAVDRYGQTVVHVAARRGELKVLQFLYHDAGIDEALFTQEDFDGQPPVDCIPRRGPEELQACRDFFENLGVDEVQNLTLFFAKLHGIHGD